MTKCHFFKIDFRKEGEAMSDAQERKLEKKRRILENAYQLFKSKNIYNTAVDDIVKASGIARGTFYLYFKDKSDLIEQLLFFKSAESMLAVVHEMRDKAEEYPDLAGYVRAFVTLYIDFLVEQKEALAVVEKNISACMRDMPDFYDEEAKTLYNDIIDKFVQNGFDEAEIRKRIYFTVSMIGSVCSDAILFCRPFDISAIRETLTDAALRTLDVA